MAAVIQQTITIEDHFQISKENHTIILSQQQQQSLPPQQQSIKEQKEQKKKNLVNINIDPRDVGTPDNWIPRHPELIRLTGKHPLNCEAPLPSLMKEGFITPTSLHYVRNHGAVPKLDWNKHRLVVNGLVSESLNLSMDEIVKMPYREFPVTLVCAGNRRKEQNMVKKTIGFNWGSSAVSTAIWKGVPLRYILKLAGCSLDADYDEPRHVCFTGSDNLPNGHYGTSITLEWAMNDFRDVLLAYEMNGERLAPDHGYPIRVIIPGVIGGRMVKWLKEITVTNRESDNYYHIHDNRVLPPNIDAEIASKEGWWSIPDYIINEVNINSVISTPAHNEHIPISSFISNAEYTLKGYAYTGGGRRIIRVEISFDGGKSWLLTNLDYPEIVHPLVLKRSHNPIRRYWCWCFWSLSVPMHNFIGCSEIRARAVDTSQNIQPENLTWNVMGMMNNCHFKVKIHTVTKEREVSLRFEHPTQAGNNPGGWMVKQEQPITAAKTTTKINPVVVNKGSFTMEQVEKHDNEKDCWIVIDKKVYDCTKFLSDHPGGADSILINAGMDCTDEFDAIHSDKAKNMLTDYYIGDLNESSSSSTSTSDSSTNIPKSISLNSDGDSLVALNPKMWISCPLIEKKIISHDTRIFRFALQSDNHSLGLPVGNHLFIRSSVNGKAIIRAYTPITPTYSPPGYFDLLIKVYFKNVNPKFPEGGIMSQCIDSLNIGDKVDVKGPLGSFIYLGRGQYRPKGRSSNNESCKRIGMIAGGSGITPVYQVIQSVLNDPEDHTELSLIYANRSEKDILLRNELDELSKNHSQFKIYYTLSQPSSNWKFGTGYVTEEMIRKNILPPLANSQTIVLLCGPTPMLGTCITNLRNIGFTENEYIEF